MARRKSNIENDSATLTFEAALSGLESIVEAMENEQLPLEELVANYEKGSALLNHCESILQSARGRIELITLRNKNEIESNTESRTSTPTAFTTTTGAPQDDSDHDDIRLF